MNIIKKNSFFFFVFCWFNKHTRPTLSVIPTFAISRDCTFVLSFNELSNSLSTSALTSLILFILIRLKSFSLALAFLMQSSTSVVLSGSGGRILNGSLLAAANKTKKNIYINQNLLFFLFSPFHPPTVAGKPLSVNAAWYCTWLIKPVKPSIAKNQWNKNYHFIWINNKPASSTISDSLAFVNTSSHSVATINSSSSSCVGLVIVGASQILPFFSPGVYDL